MIRNTRIRQGHLGQAHSVSGNDSHRIYGRRRWFLGTILLDMEFQDIFLMDGGSWVFADMAGWDEMLGYGELGRLT